MSQRGLQPLKQNKTGTTEVSRVQKRDFESKGLSFSILCYGTTANNCLLVGGMTFILISNFHTYFSR